MKKIFLILVLFAFAIAASAQSTTPRFGITPNSDNTGCVLTYGYISKAYASSIAIIPKYYETTVNIAQLTGDVTLTSNVTVSRVGDKMNILVSADGSARTITFSTGFASGGTLVVGSSTKMSLYYVFNGVGWFQLSGQNLVTGLVGNGSATVPTLSFTSTTDLGLYRAGAAELGFTVSGTKAAGLKATGLSVVGNVITTTANVKNNTATAINTTATVTAAQLAGGLLTSTSGAAVTMTLPTATLLATQIGATQGTVFEFVVDNSAGSNTVTVAVGAGITASVFPSTNTLTLGASATVGVATFRIVFISATAATLTRIS